MQRPLKDWQVTQEFGANPSYYATLGQKGHNGIDLRAAIGTSVFAAADGVVEYEGYGKNLYYMGDVAGICVVLKHNGIMTGYAHLKSTIVNKGQSVKQGQIIGYSGNTGTSTGPHLHFEVIKLPIDINNGYYGRVDPNPYLKGEEMPTKNEIDDAFNFLGVKDSETPREKDYKYYQAQPSKVLYTNVLKVLYKRYKAEQAKATALKTQLAQSEMTIFDKIKAIFNK
jgi:hypothetical protein